MKPALIDLDVIDASILENIKKHESLANGTPSKKIIYEKLTVLAEVSEILSSQPALIELLLKAFFAGHKDGRKNNMPVPSAIDFADFLTQNNLTDEKI